MHCRSISAHIGEFVASKQEDSPSRMPAKQLLADFLTDQKIIELELIMKVNLHSV